MYCTECRVKVLNDLSTQSTHCIKRLEPFEINEEWTIDRMNTVLPTDDANNVEKRTADLEPSHEPSQLCDEWMILFSRPGIAVIIKGYNQPVFGLHGSS